MTSRRSASSKRNFFFSSRRRHTRWNCDWSSDVCYSDLFRNGHGNANRVEIWSLAAPSPGTANVVVSLSGSVDVVGGAISFSGVNQTTPFGTFVSAQGTSASRSEERRVGKEGGSRWAQDA